MAERECITPDRLFLATSLLSFPGVSGFRSFFLSSLSIGLGRLKDLREFIAKIRFHASNRCWDSGTNVQNLVGEYLPVENVFPNPCIGHIEV